MILFCGCEGTVVTAGYQNQLYGQGNRVFNLLGPKTNTCVCTICSKKRDLPAKDWFGHKIE